MSVESDAESRHRFPRPHIPVRVGALAAAGVILAGGAYVGANLIPLQRAKSRAEGAEEGFLSGMKQHGATCLKATVVFGPGTPFWNNPDKVHDNFLLWNGNVASKVGDDEAVQAAGVVTLKNTHGVTMYGISEKPPSNPAGHGTTTPAELAHQLIWTDSIETTAKTGDSKVPEKQTVATYTADGARPVAIKCTVSPNGQFLFTPSTPAAYAIRTEARPTESSIYAPTGHFHELNRVSG